MPCPRPEALLASWHPVHPGSQIFRRVFMSMGPSFPRLAACALVWLSAAVPAAAAEPSLSLKISSALRDRTFWNAGAIHVNVQTKSGETYDVDGPNGKVLPLSLLQTMVGGATVDTPGSPSNRLFNDILRMMAQDGITGSETDAKDIARNMARFANALPRLSATMSNLGLDALGTPPGIRGQASRSMSTGGISLGYYLDDDHQWAVETYVLAAPLTTSVTATGRPRYRVVLDGDGQEVEVLSPFGLEGQQILSSKLLPPTVMFGRYWGSASSRFRPYTGALAMYAIFYDTKATPALNAYVGGSNPGDTSVSIKNAFGAGPMLGFRYALNDSWRVNFSIGSVKLKTQATLVTRNSRFDKNTPAILDLGNDQAGLVDNVTGVILAGEGLLAVRGADGSSRSRLYDALGGITAITTRAAQSFSGNSSGTYVRKTDTQLTNTIYMLSIGRDF
ncbi:OmpW/AlkL family protein [Aquabacterium lacunae]|uniref:OmpW/AlkL family protein n=1 Tax=Aquabacterium lacunae TaxID=2528630 RepID=UPI001FE168E5|nr:OmpW family outer membrane protein [Aquabacterium lacunae]